MVLFVTGHTLDMQIIMNGYHTTDDEILRTSYNIWIPYFLLKDELDVESSPSQEPHPPTFERDLARKNLARPIIADRSFAMIKRLPCVIYALNLWSISMSLNKSHMRCHFIALSFLT